MGEGNGALGNHIGAEGAGTDQVPCCRIWRGACGRRSSCRRRRRRSPSRRTTDLIGRGKPSLARSGLRRKDGDGSGGKREEETPRTPTEARRGNGALPFCFALHLHLHLHVCRRASFISLGLHLLHSIQVPNLGLRKAFDRIEPYFLFFVLTLFFF